MWMNTQIKGKMHRGREHIRCVAVGDHEADQSLECQYDHQHSASEIHPDQHQEEHATRYLHKTKQNDAREPPVIDAAKASAFQLAEHVVPLLVLELLLVVGGNSTRDAIQREDDGTDHDGGDVALGVVDRRLEQEHC